MQWFGHCAVQPNHFKSQDRMATPLFHDRLWFVHFISWIPFGNMTLLVNRRLSQALGKVVWPFQSKWTVDTLPHGQKLPSQCRLKLRVPITLKRKASFILRECWTRSG